MTISTNYSSPVMVNGFSCRNCTEVDQATKNIDPSDPAAGAFGINSTKGSTAAKVHKGVPGDTAAMAAAHRQVAATRTSNVLSAYVGTPDAGKFVQLTA